MQTVTLVAIFVLAAVVLLTSPPSVDAVCCYTASFNNQGVKICADCTPTTPFCGYGKCNIFGCDCAGGCRTGSCRGKRSSDDEHVVDNADSIVSAGDLNGDGFLSIEEAETMLEQGPNAAHRRSVRSLDKDMDGMLSVDEIDN